MMNTKDADSDRTPASCTETQMKSSVGGGAEEVLFIFQRHPSVRRAASPSRRGYAVTPLCSPLRIFSAIWARAFEFRPGNRAPGVLCIT